MAKLKLVADPTFKAKVGIPVAGADPVEVELVFKHRTKKELDALIASRAKKDDVTYVMDMVVGWDLEDDFNKKNVGLLLENYIGAAMVVFRKYIDELVQAKLKN